MGVLGHDGRDISFASKMNLDIVPVIAPDKDEVPDVEDTAVRGTQ